MGDGYVTKRAMAWVLGGTLLLAACAADGTGSASDPVRLGVIREVPVARTEDPNEWGPELDLALEAEYWDMIGNSDHQRFPAWYDKTSSYVAANPDASPRLTLLMTAGAVFQMSQAFDGDAPDWAPHLEDFSHVVSGTSDLPLLLPDHVPAQVFYHNNLAMRELMTGSSTAGEDHLAQLLEVEWSEGRAAASFTYAMIDSEAAVRYGIALNEGCETFICNWTSELAPFKPIGQLLELAELHAIVGEYEEMNAVLDRADALAIERGWPFRDRIVAMREELPKRTYTPGRGQEVGVGALRWPMPIFSNETNCSNCHIGGRPGQSGVPLAEPYEGHDVVTPPTAAPSVYFTAP